MLGPRTSNLFEIESQARVNLAENYLMKGEWQQALEYYEMVYQNVRKPEYFFVRWRWKPRCLLGLAELWLYQENLTKAQAYLDEVIEHGWTHKFPYKKYQVRSGRLQGNIFAARGKFEEAQTVLQQTLKLAEQLGNPIQLWKTCQALGNLYLQQGKTKDAGSRFRDAIKIVQSIADDLTDPGLKEGFIQSEPIRQVFAQAKGKTK